MQVASCKVWDFLDEKVVILNSRYKDTMRCSKLFTNSDVAHIRVLLLHRCLVVAHRSFTQQSIVCCCRCCHLRFHSSVPVFIQCSNPRNKLIMFRPNIVRVCHRLHAGVKSNLSSSRLVVPMNNIMTHNNTTASRHFAANANMPSAASSSTAGGSAFIPSAILKGWYNMYVYSFSLDVFVFCPAARI